MATDWITTAEAAQLSGYNEQHIRRLARANKIVAEKKGVMWWIDRKSLMACLKAAEKSTDRRRGPKNL